MERPPLPKELFEQLRGTWNLGRTLQSANASEPSGRCTGIATFTSRPPSFVIDDQGKLDTAVAELLYHEQGEFELASFSTGQASIPKFPFSRKYVWRSNRDKEDATVMSIWFVKPGTDTVDYLFHKVDFRLPQSDSSEDHATSITPLHANGGHLCVDDFYSSTYAFIFSGQPREPILGTWSMLHEVRGPKKDQIIETTFTRA